MAVTTKDKKITVTDEQWEYSFSANKKDTIYLKGITQNDIDRTSFCIWGDKLRFSTLNGKEFYIYNYSDIKYIKTDVTAKKTALLDIVSEALVNNYNNHITTYDATKLTASGTKYNDTIDMSGVDGLQKTIKQGKKKIVVDKTSADKGITISGGSGNDDITGSKYSDTITAGKGNDDIYASLGNDTITGGAGSNIIRYKSISQLGDKINLTNKEQLNINISEIGADAVTYKKSGKDLIITVIKGEEKNTLTLTNFASSDITTKEGAVNLTISNTQTVNLRTDLYLTGDDKIVTKKNYTGSWLSEEIDASTATKNLTLNGGAGNDIITGTKYADTINGGSGNDIIDGGEGKDIIKAGTGKDTITGGKGKDQLYAGTSKSSSTTFVFNEGDGKDTVYGGKGTDTLKFKKGDISFKKSKRDLIISYNYDEEGNAQDSVTVKNYYNAKGKPSSSIKNINLGGNIFEIEQLTEIMKTRNLTIASKSSVHTAEADDYVILTGTSNQQIHTYGGNDIIYASGEAENSIYAGDGNDIIFGSDGTYNHGYYGGAGDDVIKIGNGGCNACNGEEGDDIIYTPETGGEKSVLYFIGGTQAEYDMGKDTIYWQGNNYNRMFFNNSLYNDLIMTRTEGSDDLVIRYNSVNGNAVTLKDYFNAGKEGMAAAFEINTESKTLVTLGNAVAEKGVYNFVNGTEGTDNNDYFETASGTNTIDAGGGNDYICAFNGNNTINAVSGNNTINLGSGTNVVTLGTGSDIINSGNGYNTITFIAADTDNDTYKYNSGADILEFQGDVLDNLSLDLTGDAPVITRGSNGKTLTLNNLNNLTEGVTIKDNTAATATLFNLNTTIGSAQAAAGQTLATGSGDDAIYTGLGNDTIQAGTGNNTVHLQVAPSGNNNTYTYQDGIDTFILDGQGNFDGIVMKQSEKDLVVGFDGGFANNTLTIKNYYDDKSINESINFAYDTTGVLTTTDLKTLITDKGVAETIECDGSHSIDASGKTKGVSIVGCAEDDTITGSAFADEINGKGGEDTLNGGAGDDNYVIDNADWGSGLTTISDTAGTDTLKIDTAKDEINLYFDITQDNNVVDGKVGYVTGSDLYINSDSEFTLTDAKNYKGVKLTGYFDGNSVENVLIPEGESWASALNPTVTNAIAQSVANWLKKNGYNSTTDAIAEGKQAELLNLYNPIVSTELSLSATGDDDLIIATASGNSTQYVYGKGGNDIIYSSQNSQNSIDGGAGDDIIYGSDADFDGYYMHYYYGGDGNDTIYAGKGLNCITGEEGDDIIYTSTEDSCISTIYCSGSAGTTRKEAFDYGNDTIHWRGGFQYLQFNNSYYEELVMTRTDDDLVIRYNQPFGNSITMKDYFKAGNEDMGTAFQINSYSMNKKSVADAVTQKGLKTYIEGAGTINGTAANEYIKGSDGNDIITANGGNDVLVGGKGDDIYNASLSGITAIIDTEGNDVLNIAANKNDIKLVFYIEDNGTYFSRPAYNKLLLVDSASFNSITTNEIRCDMEFQGIDIFKFDSIEQINSADGYCITKETLNTLKADVVNWLNAANEGTGYWNSNVALTSGDADLGTLLAIYNRDSNWQAV